MQHDKQPFKIGHIVIKVKDLHQAVQDYEALGFTMTWGSNPQKAHNALIYLADGSFLELLKTNLMNPIIQSAVMALAKLVVPFGKRFSLWQKRPVGFVEYAVDIVYPNNYTDTRTGDTHSQTNACHTHTTR